MTVRGLLSFACGLVLCAARAAGQSDGPLPAGRPPEWSLAEGVGFTLHVNRGQSHEVALFAHPGVSFRLGPRFEWLVEGHVAHYVSPGGFLAGAMPIGARLYIGNGRVLPYASFGLGVGWTNLQRLDEIDQRFNFLLQTGAGVRSPISDTQAWTAEVRWAHVSNAGMSSPNLGLNMLVFLGGFRFR
jgi:Lipid A 3-O-deacylase (PagL)